MINNKNIVGIQICIPTDNRKYIVSIIKNNIVTLVYFKSKNTIAMDIEQVYELIDIDEDTFAELSKCWKSRDN